MASAFCSRRFRSLTTSGGVPLGADTPNQIVTSKSGSPDSAMVGIWGRASERWAPVRAIGLTLPEAINWTWLATVSNNMEMRPPNRSVNAAPVPLYGTCVISMPAIDLNNSPLRWFELPLPAEPKVREPGFCLASAINSLMLLAGRVGETTSRLGVDATEPTESRALIGSVLRWRYKDGLMAIVPVVPKYRV